MSSLRAERDAADVWPEQAARAATDGFAEVQPARRELARGSRTAKLAVVGADVVAIALAMASASWIRSSLLDSSEATGPIVLTCMLALPVWLCVFARYKLYTAAAVTSLTSELRRIVHADTAAVACTALIGFIFAQDISRVWLLTTFATALVIVSVERGVIRKIFRRVRRNGQLQRKVLIVGTNAEALGVVEMLKSHPDLGYQVLGALECGGSIRGISQVPVVGSADDAAHAVQSLGANGVIIATSAIDTALANRLARDLTEIGCHVELTSGLVDIAVDRLLTRPLGRRPVMYVEPIRRFGWRALAKRGFDIAVASCLLVLTAPVLIASAILIKVGSRGPVLFSQVRVGKNGELFRLRKLRTMVDDAEKMLDALRDQNEVDGPLFKMRDDPRVTRIGRALRRLSVDELPQLFNVLRGEMSMVGPRPALPEEAATWTDELRSRLRVQPGITGMWQVNGRSQSGFDDYVRHDLYYVDNWTLLTDLAIVAKTVPVVLLQRGAY